MITTFIAWEAQRLRSQWIQAALYHHRTIIHTRARHTHLTSLSISQSGTNDGPDLHAMAREMHAAALRGLGVRYQLQHGLLLPVRQALEEQGVERNAAAAGAERCVRDEDRPRDLGRLLRRQVRRERRERGRPGAPDAASGDVLAVPRLRETRGGGARRDPS